LRILFPPTATACTIYTRTYSSSSSNSAFLSPMRIKNTTIDGRGFYIEEDEGDCRPERESGDSEEEGKIRKEFTGPSLSLFYFKRPGSDFLRCISFLCSSEK
ncbi:unnamed protein product, partial [Linum tenue]